MTEISFVKENSYFVDEQRFGPYALWHHKHFFEATENGKMTMLFIMHCLCFLGRIKHLMLVKLENFCI
jgi:ligand-binding SRPBCC domain-containing protein